MPCHPCRDSMPQRREILYTKKRGPMGTLIYRKLGARPGTGQVSDRQALAGESYHSLQGRVSSSTISLRTLAQPGTSRATERFPTRSNVCFKSYGVAKFGMVQIDLPKRLRGYTDVWRRPTSVQRPEYSGRARRLGCHSSWARWAETAARPRYAVGLLHLEHKKPAWIIPIHICTPKAG